MSDIHDSLAKTIQFINSAPVHLANAFKPAVPTALSLKI